MANKVEDENTLLLAKVEDKKKLCEKRNKITYTDFLNEKEQTVVGKTKRENSFWFGGNDNSDRKILVFYPEKISEELAKKSLNSEVCVIRIDLPAERFGQLEHKNYLSALIKIGLDRSKIGDIIVEDNGADIVIFKNNEKYIVQGLSELTRFRKASIYSVDISEIRNKIDKYEEKSIIVNALRCDSVVSELARCSRTQADELIEQERVLINYETVLKGSKKISLGDIITIRGKGKFIIEEILGNTRKNRLIISIKKYA